MKDLQSRLFTSGILLLLTLIAVSGCFITNCPPGGKRSGASPNTRQCEACGPPGMKGHCYGPKICCSPEFGCLMGTIETIPCLQENQHSTLCHNPGESCSGNDLSISFNGQCAATGICCSSDICTFDDDCHPQVDDLEKPQLSKPRNHNDEGNQQQSDSHKHQHHYNNYNKQFDSQFELDNSIPQIIFPDPILDHLIPRRDRQAFRHREILGIRKSANIHLHRGLPSNEISQIILGGKVPFNGGGEGPYNPDDF